MPRGKLRPKTCTQIYVAPDARASGGSGRELPGCVGEVGGRRCELFAEGAEKAKSESVDAGLNCTAETWRDGLQTASSSRTANTGNDDNNVKAHTEPIAKLDIQETDNGESLAAKSQRAQEHPRSEPIMMRDLSEISMEAVRGESEGAGEERQIKGCKTEATGKEGGEQIALTCAVDSLEARHYVEESKEIQTRKAVPEPKSKEKRMAGMQAENPFGKRISWKRGRWSKSQVEKERNEKVENCKNSESSDPESGKGLRSELERKCSADSGQRHGGKNPCGSTMQAVAQFEHVRDQNTKLESKRIDVFRGNASDKCYVFGTAPVEADDTCPRPEWAPKFEQDHFISIVNQKRSAGEQLSDKHQCVLKVTLDGQLFLRDWRAHAERATLVYNENTPEEKRIVTEREWCPVEEGDVVHMVPCDVEGNAHNGFRFRVVWKDDSDGDSAATEPVLRQRAEQPTHEPEPSIAKLSTKEDANSDLMCIPSPNVQSSECISTTSQPGQANETSAVRCLEAQGSPVPNETSKSQQDHHFGGQASLFQTDSVDCSSSGESKESQLESRVTTSPEYVSELPEELEVASREQTTSVDIDDLAEHLRRHASGTKGCDSRDVVLLIGFTGAGKSLTKNFLMERSIVEVQVSPDGGGVPITELDVDNPVEGSLVGHHGSQTRYVRSHPYPGTNLELVDTPGFEDMDGALIDIANCVGTTSTIRSCASIRLVLLIQAKDMEDARGKDVNRLLMLVARFIQNLDSRAKAVLPLFTRCTRQDAVEYFISRLQLWSQQAPWSGLKNILKHTAGLLKLHQEKLIIRPLDSSSLSPLRSLIQNIEPIQREEFNSIVQSPLSGESETKLVNGFQHHTNKVLRRLETHECAILATKDDFDKLRFVHDALVLPSLNSCYAGLISRLCEFVSCTTADARGAFTEERYAEVRRCLDSTQGLERFEDHIEREQLRDLGVEIGQIRVDIEGTVSSARDCIKSFCADVLEGINTTADFDRDLDASKDLDGDDAGDGESERASDLLFKFIPRSVSADEVRQQLDMVKKLHQHLEPYFEQRHSNVYAECVEDLRSHFINTNKDAQELIGNMEAEEQQNSSVLRLDVCLSRLGTLAVFGEHLGTDEALFEQRKQQVAVAVKELQETVVQKIETRPTDKQLIREMKKLGSFGQLSSENTPDVVSPYTQSKAQFENTLFSMVDKGIRDEEYSMVAESLSTLQDWKQHATADNALAERLDSKTADVKASVENLAKKVSQDIATGLTSALQCTLCDESLQIFNTAIGSLGACASMQGECGTWIEQYQSFRNTILAAVRESEVSLEAPEAFDDPDFVVDKMEQMDNYAHMNLEGIAESCKRFMEGAMGTFETLCIDLQAYDIDDSAFSLHSDDESKSAEKIKQRLALLEKYCDCLERCSKQKPPRTFERLFGLWGVGSESDESNADPAALHLSMRNVRKGNQLINALSASVKCKKDHIINETTSLQDTFSTNLQDFVESAEASEQAISQLRTCQLRLNQLALLIPNRVDTSKVQLSQAISKNLRALEQSFQQCLQSQKLDDAGKELNKIFAMTPLDDVEDSSGNSLSVGIHDSHTGLKKSYQTATAPEEAALAEEIEEYLKRAQYMKAKKRLDGLANKEGWLSEHQDSFDFVLEIVGSGFKRLFQRGKQLAGALGTHSDDETAWNLEQKLDDFIEIYGKLQPVPNFQSLASKSQSGDGASMSQNWPSKFGQTQLALVLQGHFGSLVLEAGRSIKVLDCKKFQKAYMRLSQVCRKLTEEDFQVEVDLNSDLITNCANLADDHFEDGGSPAHLESEKLGKAELSVAVNFLYDSMRKRLESLPAQVEALLKGGNEKSWRSSATQLKQFLSSTDEVDIQVVDVNLPAVREDIVSAITDHFNSSCSSIESSLSRHLLQEGDEGIRKLESQLPVLKSLPRTTGTSDGWIGDYEKRYSAFRDSLGKLKNDVFVRDAIRMSPEIHRKQLAQLRQIDEHHCSSMVSRFIAALEEEAERLVTSLAQANHRRPRQHELVESSAAKVISSIDSFHKFVDFLQDEPHGTVLHGSIDKLKSSIFDCVKRICNEHRSAIKTCNASEGENLMSLLYNLRETVSHRREGELSTYVQDMLQKLDDEMEDRKLAVESNWSEIESFDLLKAEPENVEKLERCFRDLKTVDGLIAGGTGARYTRTNALKILKRNIEQSVQKARGNCWDEGEFSVIVKVYDGLVALISREELDELDAEGMRKSLVEALKTSLNELRDSTIQLFDESVRDLHGMLTKEDGERKLRKVSQQLEKLEKAMLHFQKFKVELGSHGEDAEAQVVEHMTQGLQIRNEAIAVETRMNSDPKSLSSKDVVRVVDILWRVPSMISNGKLQEIAKMRIDSFFQRVSEVSGGKFDFSDLAEELVEVGFGEIPSMFEGVFAAYKAAMFTKDTNQFGFDYSLQEMQKKNALSPAQERRLRDAWRTYSEHFVTYRNKRKDCIPAAVRGDAERMTLRRHELNLSKLIAGVFAVWSSGRDTGGAHAQPHALQVLCLFRLLQVDTKNGNSLGSVALKGAGSADATGVDAAMREIKKLARRAKDALGLSRQGSDRSLSHLVELRTGEGKSLVLGGLSAVLALLGVPVDCVCYSAYLSKRDCTSFEGVFQSLGVEHLIRYGTFDELCRETINSGGDVRELTRKFISSQASGEGACSKTADSDDSSAALGRSDSSLSTGDSAEQERILLIDEVDVFFSDSFYGALYSATARVQDPLIVQLQDLVWKYRDMSSEEAHKKIMDSSAYRELVSKYKVMKMLIDSHLVQMLDDVKLYTAVEHTSQYKVQGDRIAYKSQGGAGFQTNIVFGYKTLFAYQKHVLDGTIPNKAALDEAYGLHVDCGDFSYAEIPTVYNRILGVTGTLSCLSEFENQLVKEKYAIRNKTITASVYGSTKLKFLKEDGVMVEEDRSSHHRKIAQHIEQAVAEGHAVLVFFEDEDALKAFKTSDNCPRDKLAEIEESTLNIEHFVRQATRERQVTLLPRIFGRGLDFVVHSSNVIVHVLQTFLSEQYAEEVQIQGRTARQSKDGVYKLIVCLDDLAKFSITAEELSLAKASEGATYELLNKKRNEWYASETYRRRQAVESAKRSHDESSDFLASLRHRPDPGHLIKQMMKFRNEHRKSRGNICKLMCLCDATASMQDLWKHSSSKIQEVLKRIAEIAKGKGHLELNWVAFRDYDCLSTSSLLETSGWTSDVSSLLTFLGKVKCTGGADFEEAVEYALRHANEQLLPPTLILLMGDAPPHTEAVGKELARCKHYQLQIDWKEECKKLHEKGIPVHTFEFARDGSSCSQTEEAFREISNSTGGTYQLFSPDDLLDQICVVALDQMGGEELTAKYKKTYME